METQTILKLLEYIDQIVHAPKTWQDKRDAVMLQADEKDKANLEEFGSWFAPEDK